MKPTLQGKKLRVTCTDINCPERTGGECYMASKDNYTSYKVKPVWPVSNPEADWEMKLYDFVCVSDSDMKGLRQFIAKQVSIAYRQGCMDTAKTLAKLKK